MYGLVFKITKLFVDCNCKRRSANSKENLLVVLVLKRKVCSPSICLPNAQVAKIETNRKQGVKKTFHITSITLLSLFNEKLFCFKTFFRFDCQARILQFAIWFLFLVVS